MIVFEGIDGSGKSTLIAYIQQCLPTYRIQSSEGPPKYPGEMNDRIRKYANLEKVLFDRHPIVSNPIYDHMRAYEGKDIDAIDPTAINWFYKKSNLFIYCDPISRHHTVGPDEDPEHIDAVNRRYDMLLSLYREWAFKHAHIIYRIGDDPGLVLKAIL